jgi:hypothetical protein
LREDVFIEESVTEMVRALRVLAFFSVVAIVSNLSTNEQTNVAHIFVATIFYFVKNAAMGQSCFPPPPSGLSFRAFRLRSGQAAGNLRRQLPPTEQKIFSTLVSLCKRQHDGGFA